MKPDVAIGILEELTSFDGCSDSERQSAKDLLVQCKLLADELGKLGALKLGNEPLVLIGDVELSPTFARLLEFWDFKMKGSKEGKK